MIDALKTQYDILAIIDLNPWFSKSAVERVIWLRHLLVEQHRDFYEDNQRLIFTMNRGDVYNTQESETGVFLREFQRLLNEVDISNFFVILITPDAVLKQGYENHFAELGSDPVPFTIILTDNVLKEKTLVHTPYNYNNKDPMGVDLKNIEDKHRFLLTQSKTFCMYPWIHIHAYPTGEAYPCCMADMNYPLGNTRKDTLEEIWNKQRMREVRQNMLNNREVEACRRCYEQENAGFLSGRVSANKHHGKHINLVDETQNDGTFKRFELTYWDIRFSNLCNLRCRSCGHIFSSQWYQDQAKLAGPEWKLHNSVLNYAGRTETDMWEQLEPHLDYVEQIYFAGGEPLLMEEHYNILEELVKRKKFNVRLVYNTNFTHTELKGKSVFEYWKLFDSVSIGASLDDSGNRAEYIRKGTDWQQIEQNRRDMLNICPEVDFYISPTLSLLNARHLPQFHRDWVEQGLIRPQDLNVNILQDPPYYRIDVAPLEYKQELRDIYLNHIMWLENQDSLGRATQGFKSAIRFMDATDNSHLIGKFWEKTNKLDDIRNESWQNSIPELKALL